MEPTERWLETWAGLGVEAPMDVLPDLLARYAEGHRHYHNLDHVVDCLAKAEGCRHLQSQPAVVDLALWFHDAIYSSRRSDNEQKSADLARHSLSLVLPEHLVGRICAVVLDTAHQAVPCSSDGAVAVDIDLSILGEDAERFDAYELGVRREYRGCRGFSTERSARPFFVVFSSARESSSRTLFMSGMILEPDGTCSGLWLVSSQSN